MAQPTSVVITDKNGNPLSITGSTILTDAARRAAGILIGAPLSAVLTDKDGNPLQFGGGFVGDGVTDNTTALNTALAAVYAAGGGTITFPVGTFLITGQINIPNDGSTTFNNGPLQPSIHITGSGAAGALVPGGGGTPVPFGAGPADGGTVLKMTYDIAHANLVLTSVANASAGTTVYTGTITGGAANALVGQIFMITGFTTNQINNGAFVVTASTATTLTVNNAGGIAETHAATASNNPVAKLNTFGAGMLEIDRLTMVTTGTDNATFIFNSNTTLHIHDVTFLGNSVSTVSVASLNDAIWLGNNNGTANGTFAAPFQGYGTTITHCFFQNIKRALFGQAYCNGVNFSENTIWSSSGDPNGAAIVLGTNSYSSGADSNWIAGNLAECVHYKWMIQVVAGQENKLIGNDCYDPTGGTFLAGVRLEASANPTLVIGGWSAGQPYVSDAPFTATVPSYTTLIASNHSQPNIWHNPHSFPMIATASVTAGQILKLDTANTNAVVVCTTTDTGAGIPIGIAGNSASAGQTVYVITIGAIIQGLAFSPILGTGTATVGQFVIVDTTTNGRVKTTSVYTAGTVIGTVIRAQASVGSAVGILVGLR